MKRKEIVLIKETKQNEFVQKIMDSIAPFLAIHSGDRVAIKINLSGSKEIYANTHYETVESLIQYLREKFAISQITVVEGSDGAYFSSKTTWDIFYKFKYKEVETAGRQAGRPGRTAPRAHPGGRDHQRAAAGELLPFPRRLPTFRSCRPRRTIFFPVSLSIPNLVGFVKPEQRVLMFGASAQEMKRINFFQSEKYFQLVQFANRNFVALLKQIPPSLVLIDGLYGMEGKGPIKGSPVFHGFAIASEDAVAADALATHVMGFNPDDVPYLDLAYREGLGNSRWQNIIGIDPMQVKFPYRPHPLFQRQRKWREARGRAQGENPPAQGAAGDTMKETLRQRIAALKSGELSEKAFHAYLRNFPFSNETHIKLDFHRQLRRGIPEVIFGQGKSMEQLRRIVGKFAEVGEDMLITRIDERTIPRVEKGFSPTCVTMARPASSPADRDPKAVNKGKILVLSAGASDESVAEEAYVSSLYLGNRTDKEYDVGVACLARILSLQKKLNAYAVIIAVAGMEGALPSVVAGLTSTPVIAVPTSVGYGSQFRRPVGPAVHAQFLRRRHLGGQHRQRLRRRLPGHPDQPEAFLNVSQTWTILPRWVPGQ